MAHGCAMRHEIGVEVPATRGQASSPETNTSHCRADVAETRIAVAKSWRFQTNCESLYMLASSRAGMAAFLSSLLFSVSGLTGQAPEPATAARAAEVLDLSKFPLIDPVDDSRTMVVASQSYSSTGKVPEVGQKIGKCLKELGWKELDGASYTGEYASAMFQKDGFAISANAFPAGDAGTCMVSITNHGNVNLKQLPIPEGTKELYALPMSIMYLTEASVGDTNIECKRLLLEKGWEPFGDTTVSFYVKKNAIRLQVMVSETPAEGGKTSIQISSEQLSFDLPAPPNAIGLGFSDSTGQMTIDSEQSQAEVVDWFKQRLGESDWKPTTENPVKIDFREKLIFRNPAGELVEIAFSEFEGKTRVALEYQTAAQVEALARKAEKQSEKMQAERDAELEQKMNPAKVKIAAPAETSVEEETAKRIEFSITTGTAKAAVTKWIAKMESEGWESKAVVDAKEAGEYELAKDGIRLNAGFVDPGFIAGSITISVWGDYQLELSK